MTSPEVVIFATSLDPDSRSQVLAREVGRRLETRGVHHRLVDLREIDLPWCGSPQATGHPMVAELTRLVADASRVVFASPVYNYDLNAAAKNLLELLTANEMLDKVVGFVCAAGGNRSYMAPMSFAQSLMLDFRAWVVPRFVYATGKAFQDGRLADDEIHRRLDAFVTVLLRGPPAITIPDQEPA